MPLTAFQFALMRVSSLRCEAYAAEVKAFEFQFALMRVSSLRNEFFRIFGATPKVSIRADASELLEAGIIMIGMALGSFNSR